MANYQETTTPGNVYTRFPQIDISNPLDRNPSVQFYKEKVFSIGDEKVIKPDGVLTVPFDPDKEIQVIDPVTLEPTGVTITYGQMHLFLYSAAIQADQEQQVIPEEENTEITE